MEMTSGGTDILEEPGRNRVASSKSSDLNSRDERVSELHMAGPDCYHTCMLREYEAEPYLTHVVAWQPKAAGRWRRKIYAHIHTPSYSRVSPSICGRT